MKKHVHWVFSHPSSPAERVWSTRPWKRTRPTKRSALRAAQIMADAAIRPVEVWADNTTTPRILLVKPRPIDCLDLHLRSAMWLFLRPMHRITQAMRAEAKSQAFTAAYSTPEGSRLGTAPLYADRTWLQTLRAKEPMIKHYPDAIPIHAPES
jgi:hypothetical protein